MTRRPVILPAILAAALLAAALLYAADANPGQLQPPVEIAAGDGAAQPHGASGDGVCLFVWCRGWTGYEGTADVVGRRFDAATLRPLDAQPIVIGAAEDVQEAPRVAYSGGNFLVVWQDLRSGTDYDVRAALVQAGTGRLAVADIAVATGNDNQVRPDVAAAGGGFLVAWQDWRGSGRYGISARRVAEDGQPASGAAMNITDYGTRPAVCSSGQNVLVCWGTGNHRGRTEAAMLAATGNSMKSLGVINTACPDFVAVAGDGRGAFMTVAARTPYPDPWGWGGPGAVVCSRIAADGSTPDAKLDYGYRLTRLSERTVPNVVDAASWGDKPRSSWNAGAPGGFPGTPDGLWPRGLPAVGYAGQGQYVFAWVKGSIGSDRLTVSGYNLWIRGLDGETLAERWPLRQVSVDEQADETRPSLIADSRGKLILLYEEIDRGGRRILARRLGNTGTK